MYTTRKRCQDCEGYVTMANIHCCPHCGTTRAWYWQEEIGKWIRPAWWRRLVWVPQYKENRCSA